MTFAVGDKVVYPHHGAAIIEGKEKRVFDGQKTDYFVLRITYGDLKVSIPVDKADEIGLREVINDEEVEEVFAVLRKKEARMPTNWSRRFKNHVEKLKSGDIYQVAEVVRNLSIREADKGLSAGEKRMLARARQILVSELTFALNVDEEAAEARLDDVLAGRDEPPPPKKKAAPKKAPAAAKRAPASDAVKAKAPAEKAPAAKKESAPKAAPAKKAAPAAVKKAVAKTTKSAAK
jgi:CarD family transcriptional regulator